MKDDTHLLISNKSGKLRVMKVSIPQPCTAAWNAMQPVPEGRHCTACQKNVIDFTGMSDQEVAAYFKTPATSICGRFRSSQLDRGLTPKQAVQKKHSGVTLLFSLGLSLFIGNHATASAFPAHPYHFPVQARQRPPVPCVDTIRGQVRDHTGAPLIAASITIQGTPYGATADAEGRFTLAVPKNLPKQSVILAIAAIGYQTKTVSLSTLSGQCLINMEAADAMALGEVFVVGGAFGKKTLWQRIKSTVTFWK